MKEHSEKYRKDAPVSWKLFTAFFFMLPLFHYLSQARNLNISPVDFSTVFSSIHPVMYFIIFMPFLIGYTMYSLKRWAWIVLTEYSGILFGYHVYLAWMENQWQSFTEQTLLLSVFASILFFNRSNIKIAYQKDFMSIPRGWRNSRRIQVAVPVFINNQAYHTTDISQSGLAINNSGFNLPLHSEIDMEIIFPEQTLYVKSGLARINDTIAGFAFKDLAASQKRVIKKLVWREKKRQYQELKNRNDIV